MAVAWAVAVAAPVAPTGQYPRRRGGRRRGRRPPEWTRPPEDYLGSGQDGSTYWLSAGHVYRWHEGEIIWLCPLASFNRIARHRGRAGSSRATRTAPGTRSETLHPEAYTIGSPSSGPHGRVRRLEFGEGLS